jgi:hypothetical protein
MIGASLEPSRLVVKHLFKDWSRNEIKFAFDTSNQFIWRVKFLARGSITWCDRRERSQTAPCLRCRRGDEWARLVCIECPLSFAYQRACLHVTDVWLIIETTIVWSFLICGKNFPGQQQKSISSILFLLINFLYINGRIEKRIFIKIVTKDGLSNEEIARKLVEHYEPIDSSYSQACYWKCQFLMEREEINDTRRSGISLDFICHTQIQNPLDAEPCSSVWDFADTVHYPSSTIFYVPTCVLWFQFRIWRQIPHLLTIEQKVQHI